MTRAVVVLGCVACGGWLAAPPRPAPADVSAPDRSAVAATREVSGTPALRLRQAGVPAPAAAALARDWGWVGVKVHAAHGDAGVRCLTAFGEDALPVLFGGDARALARAAALPAERRDVLLGSWKTDLLRWAAGDRLDRVLDRADLLDADDWALLRRHPAALPLFAATEHPAVREAVRRDGAAAVDVLAAVQYLAGGRATVAVAREWVEAADDVTAVVERYGPAALLVVLPPDDARAAGFRAVRAHAVARLGAELAVPLLLANRAEILGRLARREPVGSLTRAVDRLAGLPGAARAAVVGRPSAVRVASVTAYGRAVGAEALRAAGEWADFLDESFAPGETQQLLFTLAATDPEAVAVVVAFLDHPAMGRLLARPELADPDAARLRLALRQVALGGEGRLENLSRVTNLGGELGPRDTTLTAWDLVPGIAVFRVVRDASRGLHVSHADVLLAVGSDALALLGSAGLARVGAKAIGRGVGLLTRQAGRAAPRLARAASPLGRAYTWVVAHELQFAAAHVGWAFIPGAVEQGRRLLADSPPPAHLMEVLYP